MGILEYIFVILVFLYSVVIHEVSHGLIARSLGDDTAKNAGRLTLNPFKHMDLFGSVLLPLLLIFARSPFVFGYAKPVPYNPENLNDKKYGPVKVALAGPLSNLVLAVLFGLCLRFLPSSLGATNLPTLLIYIIRINLLLAIFNLAPIPPLDGHWLLLTFLPHSFARLKAFILRYSMILFFIFLIFIFPMIYPLINLLFSVIVGYR